MRSWKNTILFWPILSLLLTLTIILALSYFSYHENVSFAKKRILQSTIEDGYLLKNIVEDYSLRKEPASIRKNIIRFSTKALVDNIFVITPQGKVLYSSKSFVQGQKPPSIAHFLHDIQKGRKAHIQNGEAHAIFPLNYIYDPITHRLHTGYLIVESDISSTIAAIERNTFEQLLWLIGLLVLVVAILSALFYRHYLTKLLRLSSLTLHKRAGLFTNLDKLVRAQEEKITRLMLYSQILDKTKDAIIVADEEGAIVDSNASAKRILGPLPSSLKGSITAPLLQELKNAIEHRQERETKVTCPNNGHTFLQSIISIPSDTKHYYALIARDITKLVRQQAKIEKMAFYDNLTGLANRTLLMETLERFIKLGKREHEPFALMFLDMDDFKEINDTLGHEYGDTILRRFAKILHSSIREGDLAARLGGDEFAILCKVDGQEALDIACRISERINEELSLGTSVGIAIYPHDGTSAQALLKAADIAMYRAKSSGKNRCVLFEERMQQEAIHFIGLKHDLKKAIGTDQLSLRFQPKICIRCKRVVGFEALLRWHHPERGFISPAQFIPIAENSGLIVTITEWIFEEVERCIDRFLAITPNTSIAINISARHFHTKNLITGIKKHLSQPHHKLLELEVTESAVMEDIDLAMRQLDHLKALGVKVSIDDYGTGHSSLAYLKFLPIDYIKVDKTFIDGITSDKKDRAIVQSVVDLAKEFGIKTVAEGVESKEQVDILSSLDVDIFQGYHFAKPMELDEALEFLRTFKL